MKRTGWLLAWVCAGALAEDLPSEPPPRITEIVFHGNKVTQPSVLQRELTVRIGDPVDPVAIERSRQNIMDLRLFRRVQARTETTAEGVQLIFAIQEKTYLLPLPRIEGNSDGEFGLGAQLRWSNVAGLNHTARAVYVHRDPNRVDRGSSENLFLNYHVPWIGDTPYNLGMSASKTRQDFLLPAIYQQHTQSYGLELSRTFSGRSTSQGLTVGTGLSWSSTVNEGAASPPAVGEATSLALFGNYRDLRFRQFSEEGWQCSLRGEGAHRGLAGSDYDYSRTTAGCGRFWALGRTRHQNLNASVDMGIYDGGGIGRLDGAFTLGGSGSLRGYERDFIEGDAYYLLTLEALKPLGKPWLRGLLIFEVGDVSPGFTKDRFAGPYSSLGVGLRVRIVKFVNLEFELGMAWPLNGRGSPSFFAGGV